MTKKIYGKYEIKEELGTLFFNHVLLCREDTKMYQVIFLSLLTVRFSYRRGLRCCQFDFDQQLEESLCVE